MPVSRKRRVGGRKNKGSGRPSGKDRSAHEAARGKKMPTLADLSRAPLNEEEVSQLFALMENESDRGCALVAGSFVEQALFLVIAAKMVEDEEVHGPVFHGSTAPAGNFSAKIKIAYALGMFGPQTEARLSKIKDIRNAFAHALRPLDFTHPTIVRECKALIAKPMVGDPPKLCAARVRYISVCRALFFHLYRKAQAEGGQVLTYELP